MMQKLTFFIASLVFFVTFMSASATAGNLTEAQKKNAARTDKTTPDKSTENLITAANQYKASLTALVPVYEAALKSAQENYAKRQELFDQGIISKRDLEAGEQAIKEAQARLDESRKQITESDQLIAEARAPKPKILVPTAKAAMKVAMKVGGYGTTSAVMRSGGAAGWTIAQVSMVQNYFQSTFGRTLPVSAYGQSATHNRMGFDHRNSVDVAVHPDSAEGRTLIAYLRGNGIPFLAFRSAVPGAATGAHIHIGYPSHRN